MLSTNLNTQFFFYQSTYFCSVIVAKEVHIVNKHQGTSSLITHPVFIADIIKTGIPNTEDVFDRADEAATKVRENATNDNYLYDPFIFYHLSEIKPLRNIERYS